MKKLNSWFEIDEHQYLMYLLQGYQIRVENWFVEWQVNGEAHREDGPAQICQSGYQAWFLNGKYHREDGPAVILNGNREWWLNDIEYTEDEFNEAIKQLV